MVRSVSSGKTPYVRFDLNDYSIPHDLVGKPLTLIASETEVRISNASRGGHVFARHARSYDRGQAVEDPAHLAALAAKKRHAHDLSGRDRLRASCKQADAFLDALALRNESLGSHTRRLLQLLDGYGARAVDEALKDALARGAVSADSVAHIVDQKARAKKRPPPIHLSPPDDPRIRDLRVVPHDLAAYDALSEADKEPK